MTRVKLVLIIAVILLCSVIPQSSNGSSRLGFWHVVHGKSQVVYAFNRFPQYFSQHLSLLSTSAIASLARNAIPPAQWHYAIHLLNQGQGDSAKLFWLPGLTRMSQKQQQLLATKLYLLQRWGDLKQLQAKSGLTDPTLLLQLQLHQSVAVEKVNTDELSKLGFLALGAGLMAEQGCTYNVLMLSEHRRGLYVLAQLRQKYYQQPEPKAGVFCLSKPMYIAGATQCATEQGQASCLVPSLFYQQYQKQGFDYVVIMGKSGTASVSQNIMQLSSSANYNVFLHELMHFHGFEDEYELPLEKQHWLCQRAGLVAPNLFIANGVMAPPGWVKSKSCSEGGSAYKPSLGYSIMEYQQMGLTQQYRKLWLNQLAIAQGK